MTKGVKNMKINENEKNEMVTKKEKNVKTEEILMQIPHSC
jgi:hypothetical protein